MRPPPTMVRTRVASLVAVLALAGSCLPAVSPIAAAMPVQMSSSSMGCAARATSSTITSVKVCRRSTSPVYLSRYGALWSAAVDDRGQVYVLDRTSAHLLKLSPAGRLLGRWAIPPIYVPNQPSDLTGIATGPHHTVYLTDSYNYQMVTVTNRGQIIRSWDTRHVKEWRPGGPFGVARDRHGNLYIPNFAFSEVEKYAPAGKLLQTFGHPCPGAEESGNIPAVCANADHLASGELNHPDGVAVDRQGNLYVSDHRSHRIVKFAPDGREVAAFGPELPSPYGSFGLTEGVAVDRAGNLYVEDRSGPRVVKLSPAGVPLGQWQAPRGYTPEGTPGMDGEGNLYLTLNAQTGPCMVVKLSPDLQVRSRWK